MDTTIRIAIYSEQEYVALFLKEKIFCLLKELDAYNEHICLAYSEYTVLKKELQKNSRGQPQCGQPSVNLGAY